MIYEKIWLHGYIQRNDISYLVALRLESFLKFIYTEKATKVFKISNVDLTGTT